MKRNKLAGRRTWAVAFVLLLGASACASTGDFGAPDWRGNEGTTFQQWTFPTDDKGPMLPDPGYDNPFGVPLLLVDTTAPWDQCAWPLTGEIDIIIPNRPDSGPDSYKEIWLNLAWKAAGLDPFVWDRPVVGLETNPLYEGVEIHRSDIDLGNDWTRTLFQIHVWPNPSEEWIAIKGDIVVGQIVVDTWCVPEPGSLSLLGLAAWLGLGRRRRG